MRNNITMPSPETPNCPAASPNEKLTGGTTPLPMSQADKYAKAEKQIWSALPKWKQIAITDDKSKGILDGRIINEFVKEVIRLAESE